MEQIEQTLLQVGETLGVPNLDPQRIFVTGGTGVVGYRTTKKLLQQGHPLVRFGCHYSSQKHAPKSNAKLVKEMSDLGGEFVGFSWSEEATYAKALEDVQTVFCTGKAQELVAMNAVIVLTLFIVLFFSSTLR